MIDKISQGIGKNVSCIGKFPDLGKAYDTVHHTIVQKDT